MIEISEDHALADDALIQRLRELETVLGKSMEDYEAVAFSSGMRFTGEITRHHRLKMEFRYREPVKDKEGS